MTTFYCLRFETPPTWSTGPRVYIPQKQGGSVIPQAMRSLSVAFYDSQGYGGGDSNPPPHSGGLVCYALTHKFEADRIQNPAPNSASTFCVRIRCRAGMYWSSRVSCYDRRSVGQSAPGQSTHLGPTTRFPPLLESYGHADTPPPKDVATGQSPTTAAGPRQLRQSRVRVSRDP
jgi:hypothetical protein